MESWGQVFSGIATVALLVGSGAGFAYWRVAKEQTPEAGNLLSWVWRAGTLIGVVALLMGVMLRGAGVGTRPSSTGWSLLSSVGDRAAVVALVAGLLTAGTRWRRLLRPGQQQTGWVGLLLVAIVAGISAFSWPDEDPSAPFLLLCTLVAAGLGLWAAGQELDALTEDQEAYRWAPTVAFAGLTATVVVVGGVNWRVWGTPGGLAGDGSGSYSGFLGLLAVWLIGVAGLVLQRRAVRFVSALGLLAAALLVGIALNVQWTLPFS